MSRLPSAPLVLVCLCVMGLCVMGLCVMAVGCTDANAKNDDAKPWHVEKGEISFYADSLAGNPTANGEKFDPKQATCAHRTLPFGTTLKITIGEGDKAVSATCRVNDRGPYAKDRVLDVSSSLAETLGFKQQGHADAILTSVGPQPEKKSDKKADKKADKDATKKKGG